MSVRVPLVLLSHCVIAEHRQKTFTYESISDTCDMIHGTNWYFTSE